VSEVMGKKENKSGENGVVWVRSTGTNQRGAKVLEFFRWVMVNKRDPKTPTGANDNPEMPKEVAPDELVVHRSLSLAEYEPWVSGGRAMFEDYEKGERIDHIDGMTIEEAEHQLATRLYQNTAKVHFNQYEQGQGRFGRRLIYGGHIISLARALSFNGLQNAFHVAAINSGRHVAPAFAGDTVHAYSEVLDKARLGRPELGALRLRLVALKDKPAAGFPFKAGDQYDPALLLDLDLWVVLPV